MSELDHFLTPADAEKQDEGTVEQPAAEQPEAEQPQGEHAEGTGAPTAPKEDPRHVPLAALEDERTQRKDWKKRAIRAEEQLNQRQQAPAQQLDPLQGIQQQLINERFNTSEMLVKAAHPDADAVVEVFMDAARANPALVAALQTQRHPWDFAYREGKRMSMLKEVGDDPTAYRERIKAEVMAEMQKATPAAALNLPASLNGARSVAPRSAAGFTGPTPFDNILNR